MLGFSLASNNVCSQTSNLNSSTLPQSPPHLHNFIQDIFLKSNATAYLTLVLLGLAFRGLIGAEGIHVLQMLYFCVSLTTRETALTSAGSLSEFVNGYIFRTGTAVASPVPLSSMNMHIDVLENFNVTPAIQLVVLAIIAIIYLIS